MDYDIFTSFGNAAKDVFDSALEIGSTIGGNIANSKALEFFGVDEDGGRGASDPIIRPTSPPTSSDAAKPGLSTRDLVLLGAGAVALIFILKK